MTPSCYIACQRIQELLGAYSQLNGEQEKEFTVCAKDVGDVIEKSEPQNQRLSSFDKPCDA